MDVDVPSCGSRREWEVRGRFGARDTSPTMRGRSSARFKARLCLRLISFHLAATDLEAAAVGGFAVHVVQALAAYERGVEGLVNRQAHRVVVRSALLRRVESRTQLARAVGAYRYRHEWVVNVQGRGEGRRRASIFSVTLHWLGSGNHGLGHLGKVHGSSAKGASGGDGEGCGGLGAATKTAVGCAAASAPSECMARSTGNHCGGHAPGWLISTTLLATLGMCEMNGAQNAAATPMRTSARELGAAFSAYKGRARSQELWARARETAREAVRATGEGAAEGARGRGLL